jgi:translation elongation factor EF-1alpha
VFFAQIDSGKSTTCGHILDLKKMVDFRTMEKNKRLGENVKYAFVLDELE